MERFFKVLSLRVGSDGVPFLGERWPGAFLNFADRCELKGERQWTDPVLELQGNTRQLLRVHIDLATNKIVISGSPTTKLDVPQGPTAVLIREDVDSLIAGLREFAKKDDDCLHLHLEAGGEMLTMRRDGNYIQVGGNPAFDVFNNA